VFVAVRTTQAATAVSGDKFVLGAIGFASVVTSNVTQPTRAFPSHSLDFAQLGADEYVPPLQFSFSHFRKELFCTDGTTGVSMATR
jgi:hypothetical protein